MKLRVERPKIDELIFRWDHKVSTSSGVRDEYNEQRCLEEYFDLLTEIKPHKQELCGTKIFGIFFTL